jgi:hypothetical protein
MPFVLRDVAYDGTTISIFLNKYKFAFQKWEYGDSIEGAEFETSIGFQEQGAQTRGKYKTEVSKVTMLRAEWDRMMRFFPKNGFGNVYINGSVVYLDPTLGKSTDKLSRCRILSSKAAIESGGKGVMVEFNMSVGQIYWNGKTINKLADQPQGQLTL